MKHKQYTSNIILTITLIAVIINQIFWVVNMYGTYKKEMRLEINHVLEKAALMEVTERGEKEGGFTYFSLYPANGDTARYIQKTLRSKDTTLLMIIDRHDPYTNLKIAQFALQKIDPLDLVQLNTIFNKEICKGKFPIQETYIEYFSLPDKQLIDSTRPEQFSAPTLSSDIIIVDIMQTMGLKAHIIKPMPVILGRMINQLVLSAILIPIAIFGLFYLYSINQ